MGKTLKQTPYYPIVIKGCIVIVCHNLAFFGSEPRVMGWNIVGSKSQELRFLWKTRYRHKMLPHKMKYHKMLIPHKLCIFFKIIE